MILHRPTNCREFLSTSRRATNRLANSSSVERTSQILLRVRKPVVTPVRSCTCCLSSRILLIAVAQCGGGNAFRWIGRPQIRLAFLLVFCHSGEPRRVKALSPIRLLHRSPDCQVTVTPPDSVPEPCSATTVGKSKTKQKYNVTTPSTQRVFFH